MHGMKNLKFCTIVSSVHELKSQVFPDIHHNYRRHEWLCERAVLAPKNDCIHKIKLKIQNMLPKNSRIYKSVDVIMDPSQFNSIQFISFSKNPLQGYCHIDIEIVNKYRLYSTQWSSLIHLNPQAFLHITWS